MNTVRNRYASSESGQEFRSQINLAGVTVVAATYFVTGSLWDALLVGGAHAVAHYISGRGTTYQ